MIRVVNDDETATAPAVSGLAIASMVLGIIGVLTLLLYALPGLVCSLLAVIFGHVSYRTTKSGARSGKGFAVAGLALGWTGLGLFLLVFVIVLTFGSA